MLSNTPETQASCDTLHLYRAPLCVLSPPETDESSQLIECNVACSDQDHAKHPKHDGIFHRRIGKEWLRQREG